jgi:peptidoglycan/xylan/chitin deacetylase (PgdA/CDA1 family)
MRRAPGIILGYHRITDRDPDPFSMCVTPERFAAQIDAARTAALVVPLAEVGRHRRPSVAITIDDGYADSAEVAAPILSAAAVPATLFVTSNVMMSETEFWWDRLGHLLLDEEPESAAIVVDQAGVRVRVDVRTAEGRQRAVKVLSHRFRRLPSEAIETALDDVSRQVGREAPFCGHHRHVTERQVAELAHGDVVEIGGHTRTHSMLTALTEKRRSEELAGSRAALAAVIGRPVTSCAYPFGNHESYDGAVAQLTRRCGYDVACINEGGTVRRRTDRYLLPRHEVYDWPADEFSKRMKNWLDS